MDTEKVENGGPIHQTIGQQHQDPVAFLQNFNLDAEVKAELIRISQSGKKF